jgi:mono/diheme cytochrome c family protein
MKALNLHSTVTPHRRRRARFAILILAIASLSTASLQASEAKTLWTKNCGSCHGKDGKGKTPAGKKAGAADLTNPELQARATDEKWFKVIKEGIVDEKNKVKMKPAEGLTDPQIKRLVAFVRNLKQ